MRGRGFIYFWNLGFLLNQCGAHQRPAIPVYCDEKTQLATPCTRDPDAATCLEERKIRLWIMRWS